MVVLGVIAMVAVVGMAPSTAVEHNVTLHSARAGATNPSSAEGPVLAYASGAQCSTAGYVRLWYPRSAGLSINIPTGDHTVMLEVLNANASVGAGFVRVGSTMVAAPTVVCGETSGSLGVYTGPMRLDIVAEPVGEISVWVRLTLIPVEVTTTTTTTLPDTTTTTLPDTTTTTLPDTTTTTLPDTTTTTSPGEVTTTTGLTPDEVTTTTAVTPDEVTTTTAAVTPDEVTTTTEVMAEVSAENDELPFTGDQTLLLSLVGAGLLLGGAGLVLAARRARGNRL